MKTVKIKNVTFINGDCMEFLQLQQKHAFDLAIVDPPYGGNDAINPKSSNNVYKAKRQLHREFKNVAPGPEYFAALFNCSAQQIIWGCNFYKGVDLTGGRIVWDKKGTAFGRAEMAYYSGSKSVNIIEMVWNGMIQHDMKNKEKRIHPTQKPVQLYKWLLSNYAKPGFKILDTHGGSGSIAVACFEMGFELTIIEKDKIFFENMLTRFNNHIKQLKLF
jgi:site-specific DNA-methyltransferase (adenine-specific)